MISTASPLRHRLRRRIRTSHSDLDAIFLVVLVDLERGGVVLHWQGAFDDLVAVRECLRAGQLLLDLAAVSQR